ncbi:MAG: hypothetical protein P8N13_09510 [Ilumatobacter sp.]|nr:hypothetical protein [Ilumatobacter sp.]
MLASTTLSCEVLDRLVALSDVVRVEGAVFAKGDIDRQLILLEIYASRKVLSSIDIKPLSFAQRRAVRSLRKVVEALPLEVASKVSSTACRKVKLSFVSTNMADTINEDADMLARTLSLMEQYDASSEECLCDWISSRIYRNAVQDTIKLYSVSTEQAFQDFRAKSRLVFGEQLFAANNFNITEVADTIVETFTSETRRRISVRRPDLNKEELEAKVFRHLQRRGIYSARDKFINGGLASIRYVDSLDREIDEDGNTVADTVSKHSSSIASESLMGVFATEMESSVVDRVFTDDECRLENAEDTREVQALSASLMAPHMQWLRFRDSVADLYVKFDKESIFEADEVSITATFNSW